MQSSTMYKLVTLACGAQAHGLLDGRGQERQAGQLLAGGDVRMARGACHDMHALVAMVGAMLQMDATRWKTLDNYMKAVRRG